MENEIPSEKVKRATKTNLGTNIGRIIWFGRFRGQKRRGTRRRIRAQLFGGPVFKKEEACTWSEHFEQFFSDVSEMIASSCQPILVPRRATYYRRSCVGARVFQPISETFVPAPSLHFFGKLAQHPLKYFTKRPAIPDLS